MRKNEIPTKKVGTSLWSEAGKLQPRESTANDLERNELLFYLSDGLYWQQVIVFQFDVAGTYWGAVLEGPFGDAEPIWFGCYTEVCEYAIETAREQQCLLAIGYHSADEVCALMERGVAP
ncbi:MAG: hypothetical protein EOP84_34715 [Verrucomicrobiaceae bacterium]|nr:MAG: hypothetical protein EOP84_34715 [Verrucomicrobiaceae bacterium]